MSYGNSWLETILMVLISGRNNKKKKKSRLVGEPSDRRLSSLVRRALVGLNLFFVAKCYGLNAELLTLLVRMGVHPKVFPDRMHTSVSNLVQHGKFH